MGILDVFIGSQSMREHAKRAAAAGPQTATSASVPPPPLTKEEEDELYSLTSERERKTKIAQRNLFMKLQIHIRQQIIDELQNHQALEELTSIGYNIPMSDRERELQQKQAFHRGFTTSHDHHWYQYPDNGRIHQSLSPLANALQSIFTLEEMMEMHNEATAHKILLGDSNE